MLEYGCLNLASISLPLSYDECLRSWNNLIFIVHIPPKKKQEKKEGVHWNCMLDECMEVLLDEVKWTTWHWLFFKDECSPIIKQFWSVKIFLQRSECVAMRRSNGWRCRWMKKSELYEIHCSLYDDFVRSWNDLICKLDHIPSEK